ncbi:hypothetical protein ES703_56847 [subsurface metagenome]
MSWEFIPPLAGCTRRTTRTTNRRWRLIFGRNDDAAPISPRWHCPYGPPGSCVVGPEGAPAFGFGADYFSTGRFTALVGGSLEKNEFCRDYVEFRAAPFGTNRSGGLEISNGRLSSRSVSPPWGGSAYRRDRRINSPSSFCTFQFAFCNFPSHSLLPRL